MMLKSDLFCFSGYSIVIAQTITNNKNLKKFLEITTAISLSSVKMKPGQKYGIIGRNENEMVDTDLLPFKPASMVLQTPAVKTPRNWLSVDPDKLMVVFLIYSDEKDIFHREVLFYVLS